VTGSAFAYVRALTRLPAAERRLLPAYVRAQRAYRALPLEREDNTGFGS